MHSLASLPTPQGVPLSVVAFVSALSCNVARALQLPCWESEQLRVSTPGWLACQPRLHARALASSACAACAPLAAAQLPHNAPCAPAPRRAHCATAPPQLSCRAPRRCASWRWPPTAGAPLHSTWCEGVCVWGGREGRVFSWELRFCHALQPHGAAWCRMGPCRLHGPVHTLRWELLLLTLTHARRATRALCCCAAAPTRASCLRARRSSTTGT